MGKIKFSTDAQQKENLLMVGLLIALNVGIFLLCFLQAAQQQIKQNEQQTILETQR
jgi:hypothetical protein